MFFKKYIKDKRIRNYLQHIDYIDRCQKGYQWSYGGFCGFSKDLISLLIETDIEDLQDRVHQKYFWSLVGKEIKHYL